MFHYFLLSAGTEWSTWFRNCLQKIIQPVHLKGIIILYRTEMSSSSTRISSSFITKLVTTRQQCTLHLDWLQDLTGSVHHLGRAMAVNYLSSVHAFGFCCSNTKAFMWFSAEMLVVVCFIPKVTAMLLLPIQRKSLYGASHNPRTSISWKDPPL